MLRHRHYFTTFLLVGSAPLILLVNCNKSGFKGEAQNERPVIKKEFTQESLPMETATYKQAAAGESQSDNFQQGEWGKLDLLVVIDNSGSMAEEQENLASKLQPLLSKVEGSDWQIAVVTTNPVQGCQRALIKKSDTFVSEKFGNAIRAGINGSGLEQGILQAVRGLGGADCSYLHWVRSDSTVAVLIVSDEDNCQISDVDGYGCAGQPSRYSTYLVNYLSSIRKIGIDARVYGLIWHKDDVTCTDALGKGIEYSDAIRDTQGTWGSICASDYTATLTKLSEDVAKILKYEFDLSATPDDGTLKITVSGQPWQKFNLDGKKVKFIEPPPFGTKVDVSYQYGANGEMKKEFKLDKPAIGESVVVTVNGQVVKDGYTWNAAGNRVDFAQPPAEKAQISIAYKAQKNLRSDFDIGKKADVATVAVTVNGKETKGFTYVAAKGVVSIAPPPPEGAKINISFSEI